MMTTMAEKTLPLDLKKSKILDLLREKGKASRGDIAKELRLDQKTVSRLVDAFLAQSVITTGGFKDSQAGRPQELLALNGAYGNYIGIDLGATHVIGILADLGMSILDRVFFEIRPGLPAAIILDQMKTICRKLMASEKATAEIRSIGICVPGFVDTRQGVSLIAENIPGWRDVRLKEVFEGDFQRPTAVDDSSRAFGTAERWIGAGKGKRNFVLLDLGYGIGMAVFIDEHLYPGSFSRSGEIGHTIVEPNGRECACGNRGCLETGASGKAIAREAADGIRAGRSDLLAGLTHGTAEAVTAQDVSIAASMGDRFCVGLLRKAGELAGLALANAINILDPSLVILGGGLVHANTVMQESISESLRRFSMKGILEKTELATSGLGIDGSALGSALNAMSPLFTALRA